MPGCSSPPVTSASSRKRCAADRVVGVGVENLLQGHLATQLGVKRHKDGAQAPLAWAQEAISQAIGVGRSDGVRRRTVGLRIAVGLGRLLSDPAQRFIDVAVADQCQALRAPIERRRSRPGSSRCFPRVSSSAA